MTGSINANFNYNANFGPVINQMRQLMTQANYLNQTLQNFDKQASGLKFSLGDSLASDIGKMGGWNTKVMELSDSVGQFGKALQKQELSLKQYAREGVGALTKGSNAHKLAVREVAREMSQLAVLGEKNGKQMGMMITPQNINLKDFNTNLAVSRKQFDIFNTIVQDGATKLINFGKNTQWAGRQITVGLSVPIISFGAQASKIFREVNVELTRFQKVYGAGLMSSGDAATIKMTENVKQLGIEFARTMGIAVKDTAALAADLAATGLEGQKLLNAVRETTRLATLGDVSNQDAMKTTLSLQNAFKISSDELAHSVDFLNAVENQTSLSLSDLTTAIPKAGPVIKALGGDVKDLSLLMVALKEGGISAAEGANAIKSGMASLINPTKRASDVARQYGIDINQIVQANKGQLMPTIIEFQKQLSLLDDFGKAKVIENVFGKYQFARISALFDNLNASSSQTMQVMDLMGASQKDLAANSYIEMNTLMNSGAKRFERATESIKAQFISIGGSITTAITPIIENVSSKIGKVIKFFEKLPAPVKSFLKVAAGLAVIAGPIIMVAGVFSNFLGYVTKGAMSMVNLGRRMSGIPVEKFKMLDDTQLMAQKSTDALSQAFGLQKTSVEQLNSVLAVYKKHLGDAITLNPNFVNTQVAQQTTTGKPPVAKFQTGGSAWVPGSGDGDKVPAMLEPGEYVVNKKAASQHSSLLDDINFNKAPRFQSGGRINGYAGGSFGHGKFGPDDLQNALKSWISPMMTGLRPFNNPTKRGGIQPYGEQYPGFFADIFNQSMSPQDNQHLMRGMQYDRKGGNMSPVAGTIMDSIIRAQEGKESSPRLEYSNAPFSHNTTRFTSFSTVQEAEFYKRFMTMFEKPKNKRSAESRARKTESGEIFPYLLDLFTGKGNGINGIPVSDLFQGQTQYGNEGETVLPGGLSFPITGYGSDIKSRMLMLHSVMPGATKNINGREVPLFQSGGRVNNYADKSVSPELLDLVRSWQESTTKIRQDPEKLKQLMSFFEASKDPMTLRRKTSLGLPGEIPDEQQLEILRALESGDFLGLAGKKMKFNGSPQSYSEHPLDWLVGKQFSNPLAGRDITQSSLIHWQKQLQNFEILVQSYQNDPTNPNFGPMLERSLTFKPGRKLPITQENIENRRRELADYIQSIQKELANQLPMGVEPKKVMIERLFGKGTSMLPVSQISQSNEYMGERLQEREIATSSTSGVLDSVSQMWAPPSSFKGGQAMYDLQKNNFPYVLNMKQMGGRVNNFAEQSKNLGKQPKRYLGTEFSEDDWEESGDPTALHFLQDSGKNNGAYLQIRNALSEGSDIPGWYIEEAMAHGVPQTAIVELIVQARKTLQENGQDLSITAMKKIANYSSYSAPMLLALEKMNLMSFTEEERSALINGNNIKSGSIKKNDIGKDDAKSRIARVIKEFSMGLDNPYASPFGVDANGSVEEMQGLPDWRKEFLNQKKIPLFAQSGGRIQSAADGYLPFITTSFRSAPDPSKMLPKWKQALENAYANPLIQERINNANKYGKGELQISHTSSNNRSSFMGAESKLWNGSEIFDVRLINEFLNYTSESGVVGKFAQMFMGKAAMTQPDNISEGKALKNAIDILFPHINDKGAPKSKTIQDWVPQVKEFLSNPSNVNYYGKKVKINDLVRGSVEKFQSVKSQDASRKTKNAGRKLYNETRASLLGKQSGGRINNYADDSMSIRNHTWAKKASAPKQYEGVLRNLPDWATKGAEAQAILAALQSAGVSGADRLASYYVQDVLAHINPTSTNTGEVYTKVWEAANLMKDSQLYNVFLETIKTRKDIQSRGGLVAPQVVESVISQTGLPQSVVVEELQKLSGGKHPNTRQGAMVMLALARIFPQATKAGRSLPIGVAAGMQARLQGDFYETLQSRALPSNLPTVKVVSTNSSAKTPQSRSGIVMPGGVAGSKVIYPSMAGGGDRISGTGATVNVSPDGKILSSTIDDMLVTSANGQPMAVSSRELLAVTPEGTIAGVTSPGDEARKKIVHPFGTSLIRGKNFRAGSAQDGMGPSDAVYEGDIKQGGMTKFAASMMGMVGVVGQLQFAFEQFTSEVSNGTTKAVAGIELFASGLEMVAGQFPQLESSLTSFSKLSKIKDPVRDQLNKDVKKDVDRAKAAAKRLEDMYKANGDDPSLAAAKAQELIERKKEQIIKKQGAKLGLDAAETEKAMSSKLGKGAGMLGKLAGPAGKLLGFMGGPVGQIALQGAIMLVNKGIQMYQEAVQKAKDRGRSMFVEPTEGAKLMGIQLKDLTQTMTNYSRIALGIGMKSAGKGAYDKAYESAVKKDFGIEIDSMKRILNGSETRNKLMLTYISLRQKGFSLKDAKEYTQEIARQSGKLSEFNALNLDKVKTSKDMAVNLIKSTSALYSSIGTVDHKLLGKFVNTETGKIYNTRAEGNKEDTSFLDRRVHEIKTDTGKTLNQGIMGMVGAFHLDEKELGQAVAGSLKTAFDMASADPAASTAAGVMIFENIKNGTDEQKKEIKNAVVESLKTAGVGFQDATLGFINDDTKWNNLTSHMKDALYKLSMTGNVDFVNKLIEQGNGDLSPEAQTKILNKIAQVEALAKIDMEVDVQLAQTKDQMEAIKKAVNDIMNLAIEAKRKELEAEDKRHDGALKNLDKEAEKIGKKKDMLQQNTDYYIKELQRESAAEDYYKGQRDTALGGLKALSSGDVFGFIGAQQAAASSADQYGRQESMQNIQDTAAEGQKKLDDSLKGIDDRKKAEDARHQAETDNINAEIALLEKKRAQSVGLVNKALDLIEKASKMTPEQKGYQVAQDAAMAAATAAGISAEGLQKYAPSTKGLSPEDKKTVTEASTALSTAIGTFNNDTSTAMDAFGAKGVETINKIMDAWKLPDAERTKVFKDIMDTMTAPLPKNSVAGKAEAGELPTFGGNADTNTDPNSIYNAPGVNIQAPVAPSTYPSMKPTEKDSASAGDWFEDPKNPGFYWLLAENNNWNGNVKHGKSEKEITNLAGHYIHAWNGTKWVITNAASGGHITGPGSSISDSIPAMLSNGEFVVKASSVAKYGVPMMNAINSGTHQMMPKYANGGGAGMMSSSAPSMPAYASGGGVGAMPRTSVPNSPKYSVPSTPSMSPSNIASIAQYSGGGYSEGNTNSPNYNFNFNGAGMDMVMGHVNKAMGGTINNNSRGVYN